MNWPPHFPADCPYRDSVPASGDIYRIVEGAQLRQKDFLSHRERRPEQTYDDDCKACGLSVFTRLEDAVALIKTIPAFRKRRVASGRLDPTMGVMKATPSHGKEESSHHTWWVPVGVEPWTVFAVISLDGRTSQ